MRLTTWTAAVMLLACGNASATMVGVAVGESMNGDLCVVDVYATFVEAPLNPVLLNVFDTNIAVGGGWGTILHDDFVGGSWAPQFTDDASMDSFVTIGGEAGFQNTTHADPGWGIPGGFLGIPVGAGWFNSNPPNLQGAAQQVSLRNIVGQTTFEGLATRILRLVFVNPGAAGKEFSILAGATFNHGLGTPTQQQEFVFSAALCAVPAPAAFGGLALLLAVSRRRRA